MLKILVIGGPTGSGKSRLALHLALHHQNAMIINADSMQLYDGLKKLSAHPSKEDQKIVPHYLYGCLKASSPPASIASWLNQIKPLLETCQAKNIRPIIVGGTGMYLHSLMFGLSEIPKISDAVKLKIKTLHATKGLSYIYKQLQKNDPDYAAKISAQDTQRILRAYEVFVETKQPFSNFHSENKKLSDTYHFHPLILNPSREDLYEACNKRLENLLSDDLKKEILKCDQTYPKDHIIRKTLGFTQLLSYYKGENTLEDALSLTQQTTRNYIKRQLTWFKNRMLTIEPSEFVASPIEVTDPHSPIMIENIKTSLRNAY